VRKGFALALLLAAACGGKKGTVEIDIVVSPLDDPFTFAAQARFTIGDQMQSVPVTNGHFSFSIDLDPPKDAEPIIVEALDSAGNVIGHGQTPALALQPIDQGPFSVWVGRPGTVAAARAALAAGRTEIAAFGATGLGVMFAGGRDATGAALANTAVYDVYTHAIIQSEDGSLKPMTTPRAGAAATASSPRGIVYGGAQSTGIGTAGGALASGELFDPSGGGLWSAVPASAATDAAYAPQTTILGSGSALVSGGLSATGDAITSALLISTSGTITLTPLSPMVAKRYRHASGAARFPDGDGALLIGGLADGDPGPPVERLIGQAFTTFTANGVENRWDATATALSGGVLLVGGTIPGASGRVATTSVVFIPTETTGDPQRYDTLLPTPRAQHTATLVGDDLLLCGGVDATGAPIASCELIGTNLPALPAVHAHRKPHVLSRRLRAPLIRM
jgi:hypothetical protein